MLRFKLKHLADYSEESLIKEIRRVVELVGGPKLTIARFRKNSRVSVNTLRRRFGSWLDALKAAGLEHVHVPGPEVRKSRTAARSLSRASLVEELRRVAAVVGADHLTVEMFEEHSFIGAGAVRARFGSWCEALKAAELRVVSHGRRYTDEECFQNLLAVWTHYGRPPQHREMSLPPSSVGPKAYVMRWGSWRKGLAAFVARIEGPDPDPVAVAPDRSGRSTPVLIRPEDRHDVPLSLRYRILKRDSFRCVLCGQSPATFHGCRLHVDHVIAFSKGGKTVAANLRTLCEQCNLGKGNRE